MANIVFYTRNYNKFLAEAVIKSPELVRTTGEFLYRLMYDSSRVIFNKRGEALFLVKPKGGEVGLFARCTSTQNLGSFEDLFDSPTQLALYKRVYDYTPYEELDPEGNLVLITPPPEFASFG